MHHDALAQIGWKTLVLWECEVKDITVLQEQLRAFLES
jgi:G:T-mismatch repair DNA endonuclease (very short patch repair protein)